MTLSKYSYPDEYVVTGFRRKYQSAGIRGRILLLKRLYSHLSKEERMPPAEPDHGCRIIDADADPSVFGLEKVACRKSCS